MADFTREYVLLRHTTNTVNMAFKVLQQGYIGDRVVYARDVSRNLDGDLLVVTANTKREFKGMVILDNDATGTIEYDAVTYTIGTPANLLAALVTTDLTAKSFGDSAAWSAQWVGDWDPRVVYDPVGNKRVQEVHLMESQ